MSLGKIFHPERVVAKYSGSLAARGRRAKERKGVGTFFLFFLLSSHHPKMLWKGIK
jgi:hypothetical protein